MSIDLEWSQLDSSLSNYLIDALNKQLANTNRLSFIGPVEVSSLDFGSVPPEVELVDLRDIYRDFLDDDDDDGEDDENGNGNRKVKRSEGTSVGGGDTENDDDDGYEWVSRKAAKLAYRHLPP